MDIEELMEHAKEGDRSLLEKFLWEGSAGLGNEQDDTTVPKLMWPIRTCENRQKCGMNFLRRVDPLNLKAYNDWINHQEDVCDFKIYHQPSGKTFLVPKLTAFSNSMLAKQQILSDGFSDEEKNMITITEEETGDVNVIKGIIFYFFTGVLWDPSVCELDAFINKLPCDHVFYNFDLYDVYKVARYLDIESLYKDLLGNCVDINTTLTSPKVAFQHLTHMIWVAIENSDQELTGKVFNIITAKIKTPSLLLWNPSYFEMDVWIQIMELTREGFMFEPAVFFVFRILFNVRDEDFLDLVCGFKVNSPNHL